VKKAKFTTHTLACSGFFTRAVQNLSETEEIPNAMLAKVTVKKRLKRAGATPLFCGQAAQKVLGVAPALRHKNLCRSFSTVTCPEIPE
jgi:hypothetical protein